MMRTSGLGGVSYGGRDYVQIREGVRSDVNSEGRSAIADGLVGHRQVHGVEEAAAVPAVHSHGRAVIAHIAGGYIFIEGDGGGVN